MKDPHIRARGFFATVTHPVLGSFEQPGKSVYGEWSTRGAGVRAAFGPAQSGDLCGELGLELNELAVLAADGVI